MIFLECPKSVGKVLHGNSYLWSMMKRSSVSRMQRFTYSQILCYVLGRWIRTQHQILFGNSSWIGSQIHQNTELWTQLMENRWNSSGIFSQDSSHCSSSKKSKSSWTKWANQNKSKDELSFCRCSMTSYVELKTMKKERIANSTFVSLFAKRFPAGHWSCPRAWIRNKMVLYLQRKITRRMVQSRWIDDDQIRRKRTSSVPSHEFIVSRNAQKQRRWKIICTLLCRWEYDGNCFSYNYFC